MSLSNVLILCFLLSELCFSNTENEMCFRRARKVRGRIVCKRVIKSSFKSIKNCCLQLHGAGFALSKIAIGRKYFKCSLCSRLGLSRRPQIKLSQQKVTRTIIKKEPASEIQEWGEWSACTRTCGAGWRRRVRKCRGCNLSDARNYQLQPCIMAFSCPVNGNWGPWNAWSQCSVSCEKGQKTRQRYCNYPAPSYGGLECLGENEQILSCNHGDCSSTIGWGLWSAFSHCSKSCGLGSRQRTRQCFKGRKAIGSHYCTGVNIEQSICDYGKCPVSGGWSTWSMWTGCTVTCGEGKTTRKRMCNKPKPSHGGNNCKGSRKDVQRCYSGAPCPVNGMWSEWHDQGVCQAKPCSGESGYIIRTRSCSKPSPQFGGRNCTGLSFSVSSCYNDHRCPVDGMWCSWSEWVCGKSCAVNSWHQHVSIEQRLRECSCPQARYGGRHCSYNGSTRYERRRCSNLPLCNNTSVPPPPPYNLNNKTERRILSKSINSTEEVIGLCGNSSSSCVRSNYTHTTP